MKTFAETVCFILFQVAMIPVFAMMAAGLYVATHDGNLPDWEWVRWMGQK